MALQVMFNNNLGFMPKNVVAVVGGHEAIQASSHYQFDLVIMDLQMPGLDGF